MPNRIRAKMHCSTVTHTEWGSEVAKLHAVYSDSEENKSFAKATPIANFEIQIDNPNALGAIQPGKDYYIDITPVEPVAETQPAEDAQPEGGA